MSEPCKYPFAAEMNSIENEEDGTTLQIRVGGAAARCLEELVRQTGTSAEAVLSLAVAEMIPLMLMGTVNDRLALGVSAMVAAQMLKSGHRQFNLNRTPP